MYNFLDFFILYLHRRHDAYKCFNIKEHFAYYRILAYAKCKNWYGRNNLLAERRSVARTDSILGLPVF